MDRKKRDKRELEILSNLEALMPIIEDIHHAFHLIQKKHEVGAGIMAYAGLYFLINALINEKGEDMGRVMLDEIVRRVVRLEKQKENESN